MTEPLVSHIWEAAAALASLIGLLVLLVVALVENIRARAKRKAEDDKLDAMLRIAFKSAARRGMIRREK